MASKERLHAGKSLEQLEEELLDAVMKAANPKRGAGNMGAANVARGIISEMRKREDEAADRAERERQRRAARAMRPEKRDKRGRLLFLLRNYQEIAGGSANDAARVAAQGKVADILAALDALDAPEARRLLTEMSPDELEDYFRELAATIEDAHLDLFVEEWCSRTGALVLVEGERVVVRAS